MAGFSSGKPHISVHLLSGFGSPEMKGPLAQLGTHRRGKACLYVRRLSDISVPVLERLVRQSVTEIRRRYPEAAAGRHGR